MNVGTRSYWMVTAVAVMMGPLVSGCHDGNSSLASAQPSRLPVDAPQTSNRSLTLAWEAPTENSDGTPLVNLRGYRIYYGNVPSALTHVIDVTNASLTRYAVEGLVAGTYYFAIASYNALGIESNLSPEVAASVE